MLRDTRVSHEARLDLKLPFPTDVPGAAAAAAAQPAAPAVYKSAEDPYKSYSAETDYFEVRWKKGD